MKPISYWQPEIPVRIAIICTVILILAAIFYPPVAAAQQSILHVIPILGFIVWPVEFIVVFLAIDLLFQLPRIIREAVEASEGIETFWVDYDTQFGFLEIYIQNRRFYGAEQTNVPGFIQSCLGRYGISFSLTEILFTPQVARQKLQIVRRGKFTYFYQRGDDAEVAYLYEDKLYVQPASGIVAPRKIEEEF